MGSETKAKAAEKVQSVRLTEEMRDQIMEALIRNSLAKREEAHDKAEYRLALRVYQNQFSPSDRRKMEALPDGWLPTTERMEVNVGGDWPRLYFGPPVQGKSRENKRILTSHKRTFQYEARSEIGLAIRAFLDEKAAIKEARKELEAKAKGVLSSVTTTSRLAEVWPEVIPFIPKHVPRLLPVVRREELNAAFGLNAA